ncbi:hypothetical protein MEN41_15925 [Dolichospermum sp. ST_con]|nr:hypothetical protein [Dolichospermum sp. ST_con]MDD1418447.1 hypothetical protein [Dolichospermum sp. ST_sed1]MDD1424852.1 hypothetical protein [Dolichospermum sp. ST_sed9]MDD1430161.1 hypothetical protein [Dolichospermum sp. ST_sed6]MDD1437199.1 hypothetical protein [Dolichospermum sp. ST_sed10]MDD1440835.1 hypothetical protein [Dolichospermum sp. ST_sed3]MDD1448861.1 hypothetical protein [Dolichospermum sp. ST_sed8]MDD1457463.1 hypothetical protein [Dolichospermum sp. ST_sed7]MDD146070
MQTKEIIIQELQQIPEIELTQILNFVRAIKEKTNSKPTEYKPIWEVADDIIKDIPEEVLETLPTDGAEKHDYYLYQQKSIQ